MLVNWDEVNGVVESVPLLKSDQKMSVDAADVHGTDIANAGTVNVRTAVRAITMWHKRPGRTFSPRCNPFLNIISLPPNEAVVIPFRHASPTPASPRLLLRQVSDVLSPTCRVRFSADP